MANRTHRPARRPSLPPKVASIPEEVAEWVAAHADVAWSEHVPAALAALDRIVTASELQVLWAESDEATWRASGEDLRTRLGG